MARIPVYLMKILEELVSDSRATDANVDTCWQWAVEIAEVLVSTTSIQYIYHYVTCGILTI
jgi:hypothetical protein